MTAEALTGAARLRQPGLRDCHAGAQLHRQHASAAATLHDVGTLRTTSGAAPRRPAHRHRHADPARRVGYGAVLPRRLGGDARRRLPRRRRRGHPGRVRRRVRRRRRWSPQWVEFNNDDTVRGRAYVALSATPATASPSAMSTAAPAATAPSRCATAPATASSTLTATVNGDGAHASTAAARQRSRLAPRQLGPRPLRGVALNAGATNTIVLSTASQFPNISIDEIVVSTRRRPRRGAAAPPGAGARTTDRNALIAYLRQLDGAAAAGPVRHHAPRAPTATRTATPTPTPTAHQPDRTTPGRFSRSTAASATWAAAPRSPALTLALRGAAQASTQSGRHRRLRIRATCRRDRTPSARSDSCGGAAALSTADVTAALQASVGSRPSSGLPATGLRRHRRRPRHRARCRPHPAAPRRPHRALPGRRALRIGLAVRARPRRPRSACRRVIQLGSCVPAALQLAPLAAPVDNADFDAVMFGDCTP